MLKNLGFSEKLNKTFTEISGWILSRQKVTISGYVQSGFNLWGCLKTLKISQNGNHTKGIHFDLYFLRVYCFLNISCNYNCQHTLKLEKISPKNCPYNSNLSGHKLKLKPSACLLFTEPETQTRQQFFLFNWHWLVVFLVFLFYFFEKTLWLAFAVLLGFWHRNSENPLPSSWHSEIEGQFTGRKTWQSLTQRLP